MRNLIGVFLVVCAGANLSAQVLPPNPEGVALGHMHLFVKDVNTQKKFWMDMLGGLIKSPGGREVIQLPGIFIVLTEAPEVRPSSVGSIVDHFGIVVKDMPAMVAKLKANNVKIEPTENPNEVYFFAPENIKVEVYGIPDLPVPVRMDHVHYYVSDIPGVQSWYAKVFGAQPGQRPCVACLSKPRMLDTGNLPGTNLTFASGSASLVGTKGRSLDHIGFEVADIEAFVKKLEGMGIKMDQAIRQLPNSQTKVAFFTDPWGTYIELTQGLK